MANVETTHVVAGCALTLFVAAVAFAAVYEFVWWMQHLFVQP